MIEQSLGRLCVKAPMTMANARGLLDAGRAALQPGQNIFDFLSVAEADSASVALMLAWVRHAQTISAVVSFTNLPKGVIALAELYGVIDLIDTV